MKQCAGIVVFVTFLFINAFAKNIGPVQNGVLDIQNRNWQKDGIINVSGNWEFYWNKLYYPDFFSSRSYHSPQFAVVPDFWNKYITTKKFKDKGFGFATYHVKILCPPSTQQLALKFGTIQGAYRLYVNGNKLWQAGKVDSISNQSVSELKPAIINVQPLNNLLDVVIQVSDFDDHEGGLWDIVQLGTEQQINASTIKNLAADFIVAGIFLLAFMYNLIQFFYFKKRYELLCFSLLSFLIVVRILVTGEIPVNYVFNWHWELIRRLEYISLYCSVPVMSLFSYYLFPKEFSKKALYFIVPVGAVFIAAGLFASYYTYTYGVQYYQAYMLLAALYGLYVYVKAAIKKRQGSFLFLGGFVIFLITILNDILYVNLIIKTVPLFYLGLIFFAVQLSILLARNFSKTFADLQDANIRLADANSALAIMNTDIEQKNDELKKTNNELDVFVHRTSHDLRAPLSSVKGVTHLMEDETNINVLHDYAAMQQKTLQRMDGLIQDIIDLSKNKRLELSSDEIDFAGLINNSIEDHKYTGNAGHIDIRTQINQPFKFISDKKRVTTIINNLVSNAIKYSDFSKPNPEIFVTVAVNNKEAGIEEENIEKIFTMFFRATSSANGSGLGLYITKEAVEKLNGKITIKSKKGEGTCINVVIPDNK